MSDRRPDPFVMTGEGLANWLVDMGVAVKITDDGRMSLVGQTHRLTVRDRAALIERREYVLFYLRPDLRPFGPVPCEDAVDRWLLIDHPEIRTPYQLAEARTLWRFRKNAILEAAVMLIRCEELARQETGEWTEPIPY